ncbi:MAG: chalcone isomerase family protein [Thermoanaerobaculia bacterium]
MSHAVPRLLAAALAAPLLLLTPAPASGAELAGVSMAEEAEVDGQSLVLNGMGLRERFFVDVYVAGLYLPSPESSGEAVLAADAPRRLEVAFVRDVTRQQVCDAWSDGLEANRPDAPAELETSFETLCSWMEDLSDGDRMVFTYVPGEGTTIEVAGEEKGVLEGKEFADALFASFIGEHPATGKLKQGLLGG